MEKRMKLQKNKYKLCIITSTLAFALTTSLAIGYPSTDSYYFEGSDVENVIIDDNIYKVTFSNGETDTISRQSLDSNEDIAYSGWTNVTLSNGRETPVSARPGTTPELLVRILSTIGAGVSFLGIFKNTQNYLEKNKKQKWLKWKSLFSFGNKFINWNI